MASHRGSHVTTSIQATDPGRHHLHHRCRGDSVLFRITHGRAAIAARGGRTSALMIAGLFRGVRPAFRGIRRMPGVTTVVVLSLAIGIGVNATVFSWIQARVLYPIAG